MPAAAAAEAGATLTSDRVAGVSTLTLGGTLNVSLADGSDALTGGETFTLFEAAEFAGQLPAAGSLPELPEQSPALNWHFGGLTNNGSITVNRAPVAKAITLGAKGGQVVTLNVINGKHKPADADGDAVLITAVDYTSGNGGGVSTDGTSLTYSNLTSFTGEDSFTYTVSDGRGGFDTRTVTVLVSSANAGALNVVYGPALDTGTSELVVRFAAVPGVTYTIETNALPGFVERNPPISAEDVTARLAHHVKDRSR